MPGDLIVRFRNANASLEFPASLVLAGKPARNAASELALARTPGAPELLLTGDNDYLVAIKGELSAQARQALSAQLGKSVLVVFAGRSPVRRRLAGAYGLDGAPAAAPAQPAPAQPAPAQPAPAPAQAVDLTSGITGSAPLWLLPSGRFSSSSEAGSGVDEAALVTAARWVSSRRTTTFERLFPPSAFHPELPARPERLSVEQANELLNQVREALSFAAVKGDLAQKEAERAVQIRSASATILAHVVATVLHDPSFRAAADSAAGMLFDLVAAEQGDAARPMLRAHVAQLLQMRGPALSRADADRARDLVQSLVRSSPPYGDLTGPWRFAMCSAGEFHDGECELLTSQYHFTEIPLPEGAPKAPGWSGYRAFQAPFKTPGDSPVFVFARTALPSNENAEMGSDYFHGLLINRHAQLGSFDMRAAALDVKQKGYKIMLNSQCAGLTTRFAIQRLFPDADIYSSWDSTFFRNPSGNKVVASEGMDCFMAILNGMIAKETHADLQKRVQGAQWYHSQGSIPGFVQFIGPAHPLVLARYEDVNQDGKADYYDGFLDFDLEAIAEDVYASITPRDPGTSASQISGEAANGLDWAAGSLDRVTQYSDIWSSLPNQAEGLYVFTSGGFFSQKEPPADVAVGDYKEDLGLLPVVCRFSKSDSASGLSCEVLFHAYLSHSAKEMKRLLAAAEAMNRALDLGYLPKTDVLETPLGRRAALLLTLAGLLEFPADQNQLDGLWAMALKQLNLPDISRSVVRACITEQDHDDSNYYGSRRGIRQLVGTGQAPSTGDLGQADPAAYAKLQDPDPSIGRAKPLAV